MKKYLAGRIESPKTFKGLVDNPPGEPGDVACDLEGNTWIRTKTEWIIVEKLPEEGHPTWEMIRDYVKLMKRL